MNRSKNCLMNGSRLIKGEMIDHLYDRLTDHNISILLSQKVLNSFYVPKFLCDLDKFFDRYSCFYTIATFTPFFQHFWGIFSEFCSRLRSLIDHDRTLWLTCMIKSHLRINCTFQLSFNDVKLQPELSNHIDTSEQIMKRHCQK